jgi:hypothetical protein
MFTIKKFGQNDFVNKIWPNDSRSSLVELIENNLNFKEELDKFLKTFERDEVMEF